MVDVTFPCSESAIVFLATDWSSFWHHSFVHLCCFTAPVFGLDWVDATLVVVCHILGC